MVHSITLATGDSEIATNDVLGRLNYAAPGEAQTGDARLIGASITAVAEGAFTTSANATKLVFSTGASETATEKMSLSSAGLLTIGSNLILDSDSCEIQFGDSQEITLTHVADSGLTLKHTAGGDNKPLLLTLATGETTLIADEVLAKIAFQAPSEASGTDAILVAAGIQAVAEGAFNTSSNATRLEFMTGASEAATSKMSLSSAGVLTLSSGGLVIPDDGNIGSASDTNAIAIASDGVVTMDQIPVFSAGINVSGGTIAGTIATATQNSITTMTGLVTTGALDSGSITSGFGTIDTGSSTLGCGAITTTGDVIVGGTTPTLTIGDAGTEDAMLAFDGNAQDFHIALDDTADDLVIGVGTTAGTTTAIAINEAAQVSIVDLFAANVAGTFGTFADGDATPSVATGNLWKHHASTQSITMFDDGVAGQTIHVISTAAITYDVTSTNLKGGSTDIVTASGDITSWFFDGTNWYLIQFMDVSADMSSVGGGGGGGSGTMTTVKSNTSAVGDADIVTLDFSNQFTVTETPDTEINISLISNQSSITGLGTITSGTWQSTDIGVAYGGTGASSHTAGAILIGAGTGAITNTGVLGAGYIIVGDGTGAPTLLAPGNEDQVLTSDGVGGVAWADASGGMPDP